MGEREGKGRPLEAHAVGSSKETLPVCLFLKENATVVSKFISLASFLSLKYK